MKCWLILLLTLCTATEPEVETRPVDLDDLAWMQGTWRLEEGDELLEETWSAPHRDAMVGMFRWARGDETWLYELVNLRRTGEGLEMRLRHFTADLEPWADEVEHGAMRFHAVRSGPEEVVFENRTGHGPNPLSYRLEDEELVVTVGPRVTRLLRVEE